MTEKKRETERENGCAEIPGPPQRRWLRRWLRHRRRLRGSPFLTLSLSLKTLLVSLSKIVNCCCFLQTLKSQLFSLTSVAPDDQKVLSLSLSLYVFVCVCVYIYIYIQEFVGNCVFTDHRRRWKSSLVGRLRSHFGFRETPTCIGQRWSQRAATTAIVKSHCRKRRRFSNSKILIEISLFFWFWKWFFLKMVLILVVYRRRRTTIKKKKVPKISRSELGLILIKFAWYVAFFINVWWSLQFSIFCVLY